MKLKNLLLTFVVLTTLLSCGTYFNQPVDNQEARIGEDTQVSKDLISLPLPYRQIEVGVYNFRDQTGQFKPTDIGSTFSTAVTQGATTILLKSLEDSKWFIPIERENLNNLLNERQIIKSTREEYAKLNGTQPDRLDPLLFAGILLEGGIVSYDTNIVTGGLGARYFGIGGSTEYRQDRISIYLRAVSTKSGEILKTVYISKTILSQALDASYFRFVSFQRLLEVETGFTRNEPVQLAVSEAVEKAVHSLIIEGIDDGLWAVKEEDKAKADALIAEYRQEKDIASSTKLYDRMQEERRGKTAVNISAGASLTQNDLARSRPGYAGKLGFKYYLNPYLNANASVNVFNLRNEGIFNEQFTSFDTNIEFTILPFDSFTPFLYAGGGAIYNNSISQLDFKAQYGLGLEYLVTQSIGINLFAEHNIAFTDELDGVISGKRDDYFYRFGLGLNIYLAPPKFKESKVSTKVNKNAEELKALENANKTDN